MTTEDDLRCKKRIGTEILRMAVSNDDKRLDYLWNPSFNAHTAQIKDVFSAASHVFTKNGVEAHLVGQYGPLTVDSLEASCSIVLRVATFMPAIGVAGSARARFAPLITLDDIQMRMTSAFLHEHLAEKLRRGSSLARRATPWLMTVLVAGLYWSGSLDASLVSIVATTALGMLYNAYYHAMVRPMLIDAGAAHNLLECSGTSDEQRRHLIAYTGGLADWYADRSHADATRYSRAHDVYLARYKHDMAFVAKKNNKSRSM